MDKSAKIMELSEKYQVPDWLLLDLLQEEKSEPLWLKSLVSVQATKILGKLERASEPTEIYRLQGQITGCRGILTFVNELFKELESLKEAPNA